MPEIHRERALVKLTRTLRVTGVRDDGYHEIDAEMVTLDVGDELEICALDGDGGADGARGARADMPPDASRLDVVDAVDWAGSGTSFAAAGGPADAAGAGAASAAGSGPGPGPAAPAVPLGADNLVLRALRLVDRRASVRLVKRIPPGAGLGGGSADAAAILRWAGCGDPALACSLGADVPFCVVGGRARVTGIGERVEQLQPDDASYVLCTPGFGVETRRVYEAFDEVGPGGVVNDLERAALAVEPRLARVKELLAEIAGHDPVLAGSGSTWYVPCSAARGPRLAEEVRAGLSAHGRVSVTLGRTTASAR